MCNAAESDCVPARRWSENDVKTWEQPGGDQRVWFTTIECYVPLQCKYSRLAYQKCAYAAPGATYCNDDPIGPDDPVPTCSRCDTTEGDPVSVPHVTHEACEING